MSYVQQAQRDPHSKHTRPVLHVQSNANKAKRALLYHSYKVLRELTRQLLRAFPVSPKSMMLTVLAGSTLCTYFCIRNTVLKGGINSHQSSSTANWLPYSDHS